MNDRFMSSLWIDISETREFNYFNKRYAHAITNISEAKEHSTNGGCLSEEKQIHHCALKDLSEALEQKLSRSKDISEAHRVF